MTASLMLPGSTFWTVRTVKSTMPVLEPSDDLGRRGVGMYDRMYSAGLHEIIVESPDHAIQPEDRGDEYMQVVIRMQRDRFVEMAKNEKIRHIIISKNTGLLSGVVNSHPHSQILAAPVIPLRVKSELDGSKEYYAYKERCIFCDIRDEELRAGERVVLKSKHFLAFCPYASKFPFEFWVMPLRHSCAFQEITDAELDDLGSMLAVLFRKLRALLKEPAYSYIVHTAPTNIPRRNLWHTLGEDYHWHIEVAPRLLRASGFEWGTGFYVNTTAPEDAARYLREA